MPETIRPGWQKRRVADVVGLVDVMPTLLELVGVSAPAHLQGRSLAPQIERDVRGRSWLFAQNRELGEVSLREGDWKMLRRPEGEVLFDLVEDPLERRDVSAAYPGMRYLAADRTDAILEASRAYWELGVDGPRLEPEREMREQLEALGYVQEGQAPAGLPEDERLPGDHSRDP